MTTAVHHLFVLIFVRERRGLQATFLVVGYEPPVSLIGWVPVLGYLVGRYVLYVTARHRLKGAAWRNEQGTARRALVTYLLGLAWNIGSFF